MDIVSLLEAFANGLFKISEDFFEHPDRFSDIEKAVADLSTKTSADFMVLLLNALDDSIRSDVIRKGRFIIQRERSRSLISTQGDVTFKHTLFKERDTGKTRCLLDEMIGLPDHERFSALAEAKALYEAQVHSYKHAADSLSIGGKTVSKVAVMNKVHGITQELPEPEPEEKKKLKYLYIEADEDHIHGQRNGEPATGMIGKLVYLHEGKEDVCAGKRILISPHYLGGIYSGGDRNRQLWEEVQDYIESHYDTKYLKTVYISGDGASWIKAGTEYIYKSVLVQDRFHLMKYINKAANLMLDEKDIAKGKFYKNIYKDKPKKVRKLLAKIRKSTDKDSVVDDVENYILGNWDAIQRAFHDKHVQGCSAEGHVSNVYSERMSSRPMGWSETGSDRMCRLRCFVKNHGESKIIDFVEYRRSRLLAEQLATGKDGIDIPVPRAHISSEKRRTMAYIERLQATIPGLTVRKKLAIRERISEI